MSNSVLDIECTCGCRDMFTKAKKNTTGLYCSACGKWQKWLSKNEVTLFEHNEQIQNNNIKPKLTEEEVKKSIDKYLKKFKEELYRELFS